ncbi:RapZ C-terminal domain-containing protein [Kaistella antarctica]|uniref:ATP-binding protein n=1 Tax=Kaistella antarctica TaxID=266748 RepID=A0A448NSE0_9FLAO|nr:RNase adapter RapZ [Kaistella antarctica]KEY17824.1 ATP-binding protein [Kaistella antarctica]VEI00070.1 glmZ(sRNA)-inactivating NTPase [Kaistella antarctica]
MSLKIEIHSFSYKKGGIPKDNSGNGGGFAFDCRGILNPGRVEEYKIQTGCDIGVQDYLETKTEMPNFLELVKNIVSINIDNYIGRDFDHLQINFGCTGGQHRSVYAAEKIAKFIREKYPQTMVTLNHDEQPQLNS